MPNESFRGTLLGARHGVDLVRLIQRSAEASGDDVLAEFCRVWLGRRVPLVERVADDLAWFARHPGRATELAAQARAHAG
ncbi:MAG: hypothetical protein QM778_16595 [Myxococcales bacterium]